MADFAVIFDTDPAHTENVKAHYYQVEDGWFHFKDNSGVQIASYREDDVVSVERQPEESKAVHYGMVGTVDAAALKRAIKKADPLSL